MLTLSVIVVKGMISLGRRRSPWRSYFSNSSEVAGGVGGVCASEASMVDVRRSDVCNSGDSMAGVLGK